MATLTTSLLPKNARSFSSKEAELDLKAITHSDCSQKGRAPLQSQEVAEGPREQPARRELGPVGSTGGEMGMELKEPVQDPQTSGQE